MSDKIEICEGVYAVDKIKFTETFEETFAKVEAKLYKLGYVKEDEKENVYKRYDGDKCICTVTIIIEDKGIEVKS